MDSPQLDSGSKRLTRAWLIVVGLTIASVASVMAGSRMESGGQWAAWVAMAAAFVKARQILDHFLDLRRAGDTWRGFFTFALLAIIGGVLLIGLITPA
jgi:caa(3)-type oxidase subunit IV